VEELDRRFIASVRRASGSRIRKLLNNPLRLPLSQALQFASRTRPIAMRTRTFWECPITVVFPDPVSVYIWRYRFYESDATAAALRFVKQGMTVIDVGAHIGYFSLLAADLVGKQGSVHSFEPTPSTFSVLRANTRRWPRVHPVRRALWSKADTGVLHDYGPGLSAYNSFFAPRLRGPHRTTREHRVERLTLDQYVSERRLSPDFIKIDAESAEYHILQGAVDTLRRHWPILSVEVGDLGVEDVPTSRELLESFLEIGYEVYEVGPMTIRRHELRNSYRYANLLLVPAKDGGRTIGTTRGFT
jgi:FkbM family methyltransferase